MERSKSQQRLLKDLAAQARDLLQAHTFDPILAELWVHLLLSPAPLGVDQVAQQLDLDEAEAVDWLDELVALGAARPDGAGFSAETDLLAIGSHFMREKQLALIEEGAETLAFARDRLRQEKGESAAVLGARLEDLQRQIKLLRQLLGLFAKRGRIELDKVVKALEG